MDRLGCGRRCCGETCDLGLCKQYTYHGRTTRTFSRAHLAQGSRSSTGALNLLSLKKSHLHSRHVVTVTVSTRRSTLCTAPSTCSLPTRTTWRHHRFTVGRLAVLPSRVCSQNALHESRNPLTITLGNESGNLINLTSLLVEYQLILCAQTSREEVGRVSIEPLNVALDQKTHHPGNAQNKVANGCWTQKSSCDTCCVGNGENMFSI